MNNVVCSRLGTMLHLEIQKGKEAMNRLNFQKDLGRTAVRMKIPTMAKKGVFVLSLVLVTVPR